ncbi:glycosyltransferase [Micromonospora sp. WMMD882]|uniref:glycosyltransferase n=1 Tax=Micromonospora sp. WMMD882 TaxID=3015151 RepID=UPI00248CC7F1|nr:glycosyltransferase [Micromonospora sp. WMMD882]WBB78683.1 glycosyltransferase [Micromonospora sp. WMMD882]
MRIVCASQPAPGHFLPTAPLLRALLAAGHEVTVVSSPAFGPFVRRAGFRFRPVGEPWLAADVTPRPFAVGESPTVRDGDYTFALDTTRANAWAAGDVLADLRPDLLVREPAEFGVTFAAERAGVPTSTVGVGFLRTGDRLLADGGARLLPIRAALGLPDRVADLDALSRRRYVQTAPEVFEPVPDALTTLRLVDRVRRPADAPAVRPRALVTMGTLLTSENLLARIMDDLARLPVPCVLAAGDRHEEVAATAPDHVEVVGFTDLAALAAECTMMICHGGFGSLTTAFTHALPIVVLPYNVDQDFNADRVERIGCGRRVDWHRLGEGDLADAVAAVHDDPAYRVAARRLADDVAALAPPAQAAATLVTELAADLA